ncbi:Holliday junction resolvase RuvX [Candidatus Saccharibacteria bacterium]|nr:Holliday junction resolvase RuvX [Candidatus Saccharibacteria bacterium]
MRIIALDVGTKRIGVAFADASVRIAVPRAMIPVDGNEFAEIAKQFRLESAEVVVSGLPRNNQGEETAQTAVVREFIDKLAQYFEEHEQKQPLIKFQDETLTSVEAEQYLTANTHEFSRKDRATGILDSEAAAIILQDFLESVNLNELEQELKHGR